jgi:hypothetical protein
MIHAGADRGLASPAGCLWTMFRVLRMAKSRLTGRVAGGSKGPGLLSWLQGRLGAGQGARPHIAGGRQQRHGMPTSPGPIDRAPLPPRSAPPLLESLVPGLGSTCEELGGTQAPWGRLRTGGAPPARPAGCADSIPIGPLGG